MKLIKAVLLLALFFPPFSTDASEINFSGFATIAGGLTLDNDESLYGYDDTFGLNENSLFGLQASTSINDKWGATAQIIARGNEGWDTKFSWAYISYDATDDWRLLFGRQRVPFYMYSDFADVSYAYQWISGPESVYSLAFDDFDGIGSIYTSTIGEFDSTFHVIYGRNTDTLNISGKPREGSDVANLFSAAWTLNYNWLTLRFGYNQADVTIPISDFQTLLDSWNGLGFTEVADGIEVKDDKFTFLDFAFIIDYENFLIVGEFTNLDENESNFIAQNDSFYVSFGYRIGDVLWHITHSESDGNNSLNLLSNVPGGVDPGLDFLTAVTAGTMSSFNQDTSANTFGLRWDFADSVAFKAEYTVHTDELDPTSDATLIRAAIVTVF